MNLEASKFLKEADAPWWDHSLYWLCRYFYRGGFDSRTPPPGMYNYQNLVNRQGELHDANMTGPPPYNNSAQEIALVFPPLVETNFGCYYPSTAVLSGYLYARGINALQFDLNEDFALYMLQPDCLENMGKGHFGPGIESGPASMPAVSARLLGRFGHRLFDECGRHLFREDSSEAAYLLNMLVKPFRVDSTLRELCSPQFFNQPKPRAYREFFEHTNFVKFLPDSISMVGISVPVGPQLGPSLILARLIKQTRPEIKVVFGGSTISLMKEADLEHLLVSNQEVDAVVRSDGEYPLESLAIQLKDGIWQPQQTPGVCCQVGGKFYNRPPEAGPDLKSLPYARYDSALLSRLGKPEIGIVQARGCYWGKCAYCDYVEIYKGNPSYRTRTPEGFTGEMEYQVKQHGINRFSVITEAMPPAFADKISRLILKKGLKVKWHSFVMVDRRFTIEIFKQASKAGCEFLNVGLETMTDRVLKIMDKAATRKDNINFLQNARQAGLGIKINLIPDLPSTTYRESIDTLEAVENLKDCFNYVSYFPFEATRSSRVGREPESFGLRPESDASSTGQSQFSLNHLEVKDPAMTDGEKRQVIDAYQAFAAWVNNRAPETGAKPPAGSQEKIVTPDTQFRLADENLDLIETGNGIQCYNWLTRTRFQMPLEWSGIIENMRSRRSFSRQEFTGWFSSVAQGTFFFEKLLEKGILEACSTRR